MHFLYRSRDWYYLYMKKLVYGIEGLTCQKCVNETQELLGSISGVDSVVVDLGSQKATLEVSSSLTLNELNSVFAGTKFTLIEKPEGFGAFFSQGARSVKKFAPLITMFIIVIAITVWHQLTYGVTYHGAMQIFMGAYFGVFGLLKVINIRAFAGMYSSYDDLAKRVPGWGYIYPFVELALAALFFTGTAILFASYVTLILMLQKAYSVYKKVTSGDVVTCACLGGFFSIPVTWVTFGEDMLMAVMALLMLTM